jgi:sugar/nucleoside kinase (ribokinase family)
VSFIGKIGNDVFGLFCKEQLEANKVDVSMLMISDELNTGATVILNFDEDRAMVTHQGSMKHLGLSDITPAMLSQAKHLHFSSYFLQPGFKDDLDKLFRMAREAGLTTSFDAQWDPLEKWELDYRSVLPYVDIFLPNEKEIMEITGEQTLDKAIDLVKNVSNILVVKQGNKGSLAVYAGTKTYKPVFLNEQVIDAIGAGDSFNAGFIYKFIQQAPLDVCQVFGNLIGAISTTAAGGIKAFSDLTTTMKIAKEKFGYEE